VETWQKYGGEVISHLRQHTLPPAQVCSVPTLWLLWTSMTLQLFLELKG